jgi:hypothetical protein
MKTIKYSVTEVFRVLYLNQEMIEVGVTSVGLGPRLC